MGVWSAGVPLLFIVLGIGAAVRHLWIPAAIALVFAAVALWLVSLYNR